MITEDFLLKRYMEATVNKNLRLKIWHNKKGHKIVDVLDQHNIVLFTLYSMVPITYNPEVFRVRTEFFSTGMIKIEIETVLNSTYYYEELSKKTNIIKR